MKNLKLLGLSAFVGVFTALTYLAFEKAVRVSTTYIWDTLFLTNQYRWRVFPLCIALTLIFFGFRHLLDKVSEEKESQSLGGEKIEVSVKSYLKVLFVGFWSLVAGASLGPEGILVPASIIIGQFTATKTMKDHEEAVALLGEVAFVALFAAFFHSFFIGLLGLFIIVSKSKKKLDRLVLTMAVIASAASTLTLRLIDPTAAYFSWPQYSWNFRLENIVIAIALIFVGYLVTWGIRYSHDLSAYFREQVKTCKWWLVGIIAGFGLSLLYFLGGPLVQFTGNESIAPIFEQASALGITGILWILVIKIIAIGFSKALWYRGGTIFPTIFVASGIISLISQVYTEINFFLWLFAIMFGVLIAERKAKILL